MRYSLTLPLALAALAASPALAQDAEAPDPTPPVTEAAPPAGEPLPAPTDEIHDPADPLAPAETTTVPTEPVGPPATTDWQTTTPATPPATTTDPVDPTTTTDPVTTTAPAPVTTPATTALTAEQQAAYDSWPANAQSYFDGLTPERQALFLRIADADKLKIVALDPAQQEQVWTSLEQQAAAQEASDPTAN